jgi:hypothetical protein
MTPIQLIKKLIKEEFEAQTKQLAQPKKQPEQLTDEQFVKSLSKAANVGLNNYVVLVGNNSDRIGKSDALKQRITEHFKGVMSKYGARRQDVKAIFDKNNITWPDWLKERTEHVDGRVLAEEWIRGTIVGKVEDKS